MLSRAADRLLERLARLAGRILPPMKPFWSGMFHHDITFTKAVRTTGAIGGSKASYPGPAVFLEKSASVQRSTVGRTDAGGRIYSDVKHVVRTPEEPGHLAGTTAVETGDRFEWKGHTLIADGQAEPNGIGADVICITQCTEVR